MNAEYQHRFESLEARRAAIFSRAERLDDRQLNQQPGEGEWSVSQVMCHLLKAEKASLAGVNKRMSDRARLEKAGISSSLKSTLLGLLLSSPLRFKAPSRAAEVPEHQDLETTRRLWDEVRAGWKELIDSFPSDLADQAVFLHPVVGGMNLGQALRFMEDHITRHTQQIDRIIAKVG